MRLRFTVLFSLALTACGSPMEPDDAGGGDAGPDAGLIEDAGGMDATMPPDDAGFDAGSDAGPPCPDGMLRCDGACVDPMYDAMHCGACGVVCDSAALPHGRDLIFCNMGFCAANSCEQGWSDCASPDPIPGRQCNESVQDPENCGYCGQRCLVPERPLCATDTTSITGYACVAACPSGQALCGGTCADVESDEARCGSCDNACPSVVANGRVECVDGRCLTFCDAGYHGCGAGGVWMGGGLIGPDVRCLPNDSPSSCGGLCSPCGGGGPNTLATCDGTSCGFECLPGFGSCGQPGCSYRIDQQDRCGDCGVRCADTELCAPDGAGSYECVPGCPPDAPTACGTTCVDLQTSLGACGACGQYCLQPLHGSAECRAGECRANCEPGYHECDGGCAPDDSVYSCGSSCTPCPSRPFATASCDGTACRYTCLEGYGDCDGNPSNGCETWTFSSSHCGACGIACTDPRPVCGFGETGFACTSGCTEPGQERCGSLCTDTAIDPLNCGGCGNDCWDTPPPANAYRICAANACDFACTYGFHRCGDACVSNNDVDHCGTRCTRCTAPSVFDVTCDGVSCGVRPRMPFTVGGAPQCRSNDMCQDGNFCNGYEQCDPEVSGANGFGCVAGAPPCPAGSACTGSACIYACIAPDLPAGAGGGVSDPYTCPCTTETCCTDLYGTGARITPPGFTGPCGCVPPSVRGGYQCARNSDCSDGLFCNGVERCLPGAPYEDGRGCIGPPIHPDGSPVLPCEGEICSEAEDRCYTVACTDPDYDDDGVNRWECGNGPDCDDGDPLRFPGNPEQCDAQGHDEDCNPCTVNGAGDVAGDIDGYISASCTNAYFGLPPVCDPTSVFVDQGLQIVRGRDCDDSNSNVHPNQTDPCNMVDDNCDGVVDDGTATLYYRDRDSDGFADANCTSRRCGPAAGYTTRIGDCDDMNPSLIAGSQICDVNTGGVLVCTGGVWTPAACATGQVCRTQPDGRGFCL